MIYTAYEIQVIDVYLMLKLKKKAVMCFTAWFDFRLKFSFESKIVNIYSDFGSSMYSESVFRFHDDSIHLPLSSNCWGSSIKACSLRTQIQWEQSESTFIICSEWFVCCCNSLKLSEAAGPSITAVKVCLYMTRINYCHQKTPFLFLYRPRFLIFWNAISNKHFDRQIDKTDI